MSSPAIADELVALTTTDIFRWLDDEGHFPRSAVRKHAELSRDIKKAKITPRPDLFCASCGLNYLLHPSTAKVEPPVRGFVCDVVPKQIRQLPVVDTIRLLYNPSGTPLGPTWHSPSESWLSPHDLVAASDPGVTLAIRDIVRALKLSSFNAIHEPSLVGDTEYPLAKLGATPEQVTEHLAPYALMSILTKSFIRMLIRCGLQVARHDADVATQGRRKVKTMLLTPSHISRGLPLPYTITPPRSAYP
jgi:hypothetical protein